jgi:hypothetical protein
VTLEADESRLDDESNEVDQFIDFGDVGAGCAKDHSRRTHAQLHQPEQTRGILVNHQGLIFAIWLGMAVLALIWGNLYQWHTRRVLSQTQHEVSSLADRRVPTAAPDISISRIAS